MPIYEHQCRSCLYEWEDIYGMKDPVPEHCPECQATEVQRLISLPAEGKVPLTGHELQQQIKDDARKWSKKANKDENFLANLIGEQKFQEKTVEREKLVKDLPKPSKIKRSKSA